LGRRFGKAKLFVSGGGGLFQNTRSLGSIVFYGLQMVLAKRRGARVMVYAQGLGPFRGKLAESLTRRAFAHADVITVRDDASMNLLKSWGLNATQTADPVWCLTEKPLPQAIEKQLSELPSAKLIGISLRESHNFSDTHLQSLARGLANELPRDWHPILIPFQPKQDDALLARLAQELQHFGRQATVLDTSSLELPSQWLSLCGKLKFMVGMRLHALIMSLRSAVPVVGIGYDPKVEYLTRQFDQPCLNLTKEKSTRDWQDILKSAFAETDRLSQTAMRNAESAKKLACQNINQLDTILSMQRED
jgi:polysaccharide pyruvyl transferase CsaB